MVTLVLDIVFRNKRSYLSYSITPLGQLILPDWLMTYLIICISYFGLLTTMGRKGKELCLAEKQSILSLRKASLTLQEISDIGRPLSTVHTFLKRRGTTKDVENKQKSGLPKKCSAQD